MTQKYQKYTFLIQSGRTFYYSNHKTTPNLTFLKKRQLFNFRVRFFTFTSQKNNTKISDLRKIKIVNLELEKYLYAACDEVSEMKLIEFSDDPNGIDTQIALEKRFPENLLKNTIVKQDIVLTILEEALKIKKRGVGET
jgi:hypothetical protein